MANDLENMLTRLTEMEMAVVPNSDAVVIAAYAQEATPYWINHIDGFTVEDDSENRQIYTYRITATLVIAPITEGYQGQPERKTHQWVLVVLAYFGRRRQMKRTVADSAVTGLHPKGVKIASGRIAYGIQASGLGQPMDAIDFTFEIPMYEQTDQLIF